MKNRNTLITCMAGLVLMAANALAEEQPATTITPVEVVNTPGFIPQIEEYTIGVQDLLEISVFQAPDLSRTMRVNSRGMISMPMIGAVEAGGQTAQKLERIIADKYAEKLLQDPQVSVFIKEYVSQRVVIEGKVKKTGVYPIIGRTTLLQALAMAEGLDPLADESKVKIFRQLPDGQKNMMVFDLEQIRAGQVEDPRILGSDVVVVEQAYSRAAVKNITDTIRGIFSFGRW